MKKVLWQEPLVLTDIRGEEVKANPMKFGAFILDRLLDPIFGKSMQSILSAIAIKEVVEDGPDETGALWFESADWKLLRQVTENPTNGYNTAIAHNFIQFMKAIIEAEDGRPKTGAG